MTGDYINVPTNPWPVPTTFPPFPYHATNACYCQCHQARVCWCACGHYPVQPYYPTITYNGTFTTTTTHAHPINVNATNALPVDLL